MSDEELRAAYRRLVQLHHPDHNNGSPESARRFEEVQEAYAAITRERRRAPTRPRSAPPPPPGSPDVEQRLADLERELRERARAARERAQRAAREAAASATRSKSERSKSERSKSERPTDEELGYIKTDDSLGNILADGLDEFADWLRRHDHRRD